MPIKLPKGFPRRKSSANALEEVLNPPQPSFKVFERPGRPNKSFDGTFVLRSPEVTRAEQSPPANDRREEDDNDELFPIAQHDPSNQCESPDLVIAHMLKIKYSGSGGTVNSLSTKAPYGSAASSARLSSSSTIPSSSSNHSEVLVTSANQRPFHDIPVPPTQPSRPSFSLKSAGRTFSFGTKPARSSPGVSPPRASTSTTTTDPSTPTADGTRERAMTASTASTATPPRLLDSDFSIDGDDADEFSNMFANIGKRSSRNLIPARGLNENVGAWLAASVVRC
jgi:hypothetical protein